MVESARGFGLVVEAGDRLLVVQQIGVNDLHRDRATEGRLDAAIHATHAADAKQILEQVGAADGASDQRIAWRRRRFALDALAAARAKAITWVAGDSAMRALHAGSITGTSREGWNEHGRFAA